MPHFSFLCFIWYHFRRNWISRVSVLFADGWMLSSIYEVFQWDSPPSRSPCNTALLSLVDNSSPSISQQSPQQAELAQSKNKSPGELIDWLALSVWSVKFVSTNDGLIIIGLLWSVRSFFILTQNVLCIVLVLNIVINLHSFNHVLFYSVVFVLSIFYLSLLIIIVFFVYMPPWIFFVLLVFYFCWEFCFVCNFIRIKITVCMKFIIK